MRTVRSQADELQDELSERGGLDCSTSRDMARQEKKEEADINFLMARFGVGLPQRTPTFGEVDYEIDLQTALAAVEQAEQVHRNLPRKLKTKYPTWRSMLNAASTGDLITDLQQATEEAKPPKPPAVPPEPTS